MIDKIPGAVEYELLGTIVLSQRKDGGTGIALIKIKYVFKRSTLKTENTLFVITDDKDIGGFFPVLGEKVDESILGSVSILIFIYQEVLELFLKLETEVFIFLELVDDTVDHVLKVIVSCVFQILLVAGVDFGKLSVFENLAAFAIELGLG